MEKSHSRRGPVVLVPLKDPVRQETQRGVTQVCVEEQGTIRTDTMRSKRRPRKRQDSGEQGLSLLLPFDLQSTVVIALDKDHFATRDK